MPTTDAIELCEEVARRMAAAILSARRDGNDELASGLTHARDLWLRAAAKEKAKVADAVT